MFSTLNYQKINLPEKYIVGNYDVELPILPKLLLSDVEIKQSHTTTVEIPAPGIATFIKASNGYGSIYVLKEKKQEWIYNINPNIKNESILLLPGTYRVVFRAINAKQTLYTIVKTFEIKSGSSIGIELF